MELAISVNWLTVKELLRCHTLIMGWKIVKMGAPATLEEKFVINPDGTIDTKTPRLQNTELGTRWRMLRQWNSIPLELRETGSPGSPDPGDNRVKFPTAGFFQLGQIVV